MIVFSLSMTLATKFDSSGCFGISPSLAFLVEGVRGFTVSVGVVLEKRESPFPARRVLMFSFPVSWGAFSLSASFFFAMRSPISSCFILDSSS